MIGDLLYERLQAGDVVALWSKTALAEAEIEYHDHTSPRRSWVKFPVERATTWGLTGRNALDGASVVIWTTTPWTIPGNRAICLLGQKLCLWACTK